MNDIKTVYLSGLGAVGSTYASMLYEMDPGCIKIIADSKRADQYRKSNIQINGKNIPFEFLCPGEVSVPPDLIIIAVKQHHLPQTIEDIRSFVGPKTLILSLLNGISSEEILGTQLGMEKMLYSFCVGIDATREGRSTRYTKPGKIVFGERTNTTFSPRVAAIKVLFDRAGIPCLVPEDMIRELWWKFMMNVGINQTSAILKANYGVFQSIGEARELMVMASLEVISLARKLNINLSEKDVDEYLNIIGTLSPEGKTSMLQDMEAGRKTEVEIFAGTVIELGQQLQVETPVNSLLYKMIRTLEQINSAF